MSPPAHDVPALRMRSDRDELADRISRALPRDGLSEPQPGLFFRRISRAAQRVHGVSEPSFCVIAQGSKEILVGDDAFRYDPAHYLISTMHLPVVSQVVDASPRKPYLSVRLVLDPAVVTEVMVSSAHLNPRAETAANSAFDVSPLDAPLLDAALRLVRLIDSPAEYRALSPLITREIVYRLLAGAQSYRMRHLATLGGQAHRISRAVQTLRANFDKPLRIDRVAKQLGMSPSGFHAHFKAVTALSPLQFQKHLRLQEARRLMLAENLDAAQAGYRVGYEDPSHFTREYKRHFGAPPAQDATRLRHLASA